MVAEAPRWSNHTAGGAAGVRSHARTDSHPLRAEPVVKPLETGKRARSPCSSAFFSQTPAAPREVPAAGV